MLTLPIGIQTRCLGQPLRAALRTASGLGVDGVELDARSELRPAEFTGTALRQFRKLLEDLRLKVLAVAFPTRRGFDEPEDLDRRLQATRQAMEFAYSVGARVVIGRAGRLPEGDTEQQAPDADRLVEALGTLATHGERVGARFAFESAAAPAAQAAFLARLPGGSIGVSLNPLLLLGGGVEPKDAAALLGPDTLHVRAVDAVREASAQSGGAAEVQLGRGEADLPRVLATLEEHSYRGPVTIQRTAGGDPIGDAGDAVAYLRELGA